MPPLEVVGSVTWHSTMRQRLLFDVAFLFPYSAVLAGHKVTGTKTTFPSTSSSYMAMWLHSSLWDTSSSGVCNNSLGLHSFLHSSRTWTRCWAILNHMDYVSGHGSRSLGLGITSTSVRGQVSQGRCVEQSPGHPPPNTRSEKQTSALLIWVSLIHVWANISTQYLVCSKHSIHIGLLL